MRPAVLTRDELLDRLLETFRRKGYDGASLSDLMQATGLQKGGLYHHFPGGKEEMAAAALHRVDVIFETTVFAPLRQPGPAATRLRAMVEALDEYFESGTRICLPALIGLGPHRDQFSSAIAAYFQRWIDALAVALAETGIPSQTNRAAAAEAVALIQGGIVLSRALGTTEPFRQALATTLDLPQR